MKRAVKVKGLPLHATVAPRSHFHYESNEIVDDISPELRCSQSAAEAGVEFIGNRSPFGFHLVEEGVPGRIHIASGGYDFDLLG